MKLPSIPSYIFRIGLFAIVAILIVLMFPRYTNAFRYHYEIGKPWGYNALTADYDFLIYKTDNQMADELYFEVYFLLDQIKNHLYSF